MEHNGQQQHQEGHEHHGLIHYVVGDEPQTTMERTLTPRQIMTNAGINPDENYLVEIRGREPRISYKDKPDEPIHMHENQKFIVVFVGTVPVS